MILPMTFPIRRCVLVFSSCFLVACARSSHPNGDPPQAKPQPSPPVVQTLPQEIQNNPTEVPAEDPLLPQDLKQSDSPEVLAQVKRAMWSTTLGGLLRAYLFELSNPDLVSSRAHDIVERVFSNVRLSLTRVSAIQLMIEDLYEKNLVDKTVNDRISLLQSSLALKRNFLASEASKDLFAQIPIFVAIGLVGGSPLVREQLHTLTQMGLKKPATWWGQKGAREEFTELKEQLHLRGLVSRGVFTDYEPYQAFSTFLHGFGGYAIIYYALRTGSPDSIAIQNKVWLYGLNRLVDLKEI